MARRKPPTTHGLAVVDKPAGVTSHDVVGTLRGVCDAQRLAWQTVGRERTATDLRFGVDERD